MVRENGSEEWWEKEVGDEKGRKAERKEGRK
jgi:hypothetical protein